ncbi:hypothetical protein F5880DRAFT_1511793, partial [Lentinula raphanica]
MLTVRQKWFAAAGVRSGRQSEAVGNGQWPRRKAMEDSLIKQTQTAMSTISSRPAFNSSTPIDRLNASTLRTKKIFSIAGHRVRYKIELRERVVVTVLVLMLALLLPAGYAIPTPPSNEFAGSSEESPPTSWTAYVYTITYAEPPPSFRLPLSIRYPKTYKNLKSAEAIKLEDEKEAKLKQVKEKVDNLIKAGMCHLLKAEYKGAFEAKNALTLVRTPKDKWYPSYELGPSIEYHATAEA